LPLPPRRAPRGYHLPSSIAAQSPRKGEEGERDSTIRSSPGRADHKITTSSPLTGGQWRVELIAYALEVFFVYIEEEGFAQVNLSDAVVAQIAKALNLAVDEKQRTVSTSIAKLSIGIGEGDEQNRDSLGIESSKTVPEESLQVSLQGLDMQSVMKLAAKLEKGVDIEALPNIFNDAQEEIFNLMQSDSYRRYIRSHLFREFIEKHKDTQETIKAMQITKLVDE